jgi:hypothetical protein
VTSTEQLTLTEFLLQRIAEDEERAADAGHGGTRRQGQPLSRWVATQDGLFLTLDGTLSTYSPLRGLAGRPTVINHVARWDPARVLAECEAKRRIVKLCADIEGKAVEGNWWNLQEHEAILAALALPYADHPDYREEWRP